MALILTAADGQNFYPPLFRQAALVEGKFSAERGLPHPFGIASHSWAQVERTLDRALNAFDGAMKENPGSGARPAFHALLDDHRAFIYAVAEFNEAISESIPSCIVPPGTKLPKGMGVQKLRRHTDLICNKLKHNQSRLVAVEAVGTFVFALGYGVYSHDKGGVLRPNPEIHSARRAFSFATDIRLVLVNAYLVAAAIADAIFSSKDGELAEPKAVPQSEKLKVLLARVAALPIYGFPWEAQKFMPVFDFDGAELRMRDHGGNFSAVPGQHHINTHISGDGATTSFAFA
jgi:hypothetical protein